MSKIGSIMILLLCSVVPVAGIFVYEWARTRDVTAEIIARAPEKGNFFPRKVSVPVNKLVRLRIRNVDTVTHGFAIPALGVEAGDIKAGRLVILEFTPKKPGNYVFQCTAWCGENHLQMRGVLEVTEE